MPLIQTIQQAVLQTIKRNGGRAFNMAEVVEIKELCDRLLPSDLGLEVPRPVSVDQLPRFRPIRYIEVYEDTDISMGIFVMPPGTSIPLHNHPQMTVISRVLYGSMQVNAFDLVAPEIDEEFWRRKEERIRNAELKHNRFPRFRPRHLKVAVRRNTELVHGPTTIELLPDRCNIHEFVAVGDVGCAIFDILTPGYNPLYVAAASVDIQMCNSTTQGRAGLHILSSVAASGRGHRGRAMACA
ncbi:hypothetical protein, variant 2 [Aphanomyces invadans]|uniref:Cysteine dioxygenase n=1 Tax=Aphanomyces invadans TaxID=157072 RepID=A0A024USG7_9STRA|nr:hypothetical protein, variant 2 [Aphanomyces invadans]ETW08862.1 hypothetical protein, variant 2 [Aphanomyces invadans]|eukprot:XP_008862667.1 hypothetical protein, variant 2 [Aphanomyces invadans]